MKYDTYLYDNKLDLTWFDLNTTASKMCYKSDLFSTFTIAVMHFITLKSDQFYIFIVAVLDAMSIYMENILTTGNVMINGAN